MGKRTCSIGGCVRSRLAKGLCQKHYDRQRNYGSTDDPRKTHEQRFWSKVVRTDTCWHWTGFTRFGYGRFGLERRIVMAHRYAYELLVEPIPAGLHIDHRCHNRACVNPDHLRVVTIAQNNQNHNGPRANNQSGVRGVSWDKSAWCARVNHQGKKHYLGRFERVEDAEAAVIAKRNELHTHNDLDRKGEAA